MLKFCKENGEAFDLDYTGDIFVMTPDGKLVAKCCGDSPDDDGHYDIGNPFDPDDWEVLIGDPEDFVFRMQIVAAYTATRILQRVLV